MKRLCLILALVAIVGCGNNDSEAGKGSTPIDHSYSDYASLLNDYVANGLVNYQGLIDDRMRLDRLVSSVATADISIATADQKLAFYINAYNILTLRSIVDAYPVKSIKDIDGVWDKKKWSITGKKLTLNQIEHDILRKDFTEPRIHVAIVCASMGCPPLPSTPYLADSLEIQLNRTASAFATTAIYNQIDPIKGVARLSAVFDWFGDDFIDKYLMESSFPSLSRKENSSLSFIISHFPTDQMERLFATDFRIDYIEYDWSLNEMK
jgi:hypothetical protein